MAITVIASSVLAKVPLATTTWNIPANTGCSPALGLHGGSKPPCGPRLRVDAVVSAVLSGLLTAGGWRQRAIAIGARPTDRSAHHGSRSLSELLFIRGCLRMRWNCVVEGTIRRFVLSSWLGWIWLASHLFAGPSYAKGESRIESNPI